MDDQPLNKKRVQRPEMIGEKHGWSIFSDDVAWFIYDFFRYKLDGYEKLIFYSYYINGMSMEEIAEAACCTFQNIGLVIKKIETKLAQFWKRQNKRKRT